MQIVEDGVAVLTILSVLCFAGYVVASLRTPGGERPRTPVYNRLGEPLPPEQNPGYKETEDEEQ
jgi:hypothetical protein